MLDDMFNLAKKYNGIHLQSKREANSTDDDIIIIRSKTLLNTYKLIDPRIFPMMNGKNN